MGEGEVIMRKMSEAFDLLEEELVWRPNRQGEMRGEGRRRELARMSLPVALGDRWVVIYTNIVSVQTHTLTPGTRHCKNHSRTSSNC